MDNAKGKISNALLDMQFSLSENSLNLLLYVMQRAYVESTNNEKFVPIISADRQQLFKVGNVKKNGQRLRLYLNELQSTIFTADVEGVTISAPMISAYVYRADIDRISIEISTLFWPYLSDFIKNYTVIDIAQLWLIKGRHAKRFYLDVIRWANAGKMKLSLDNLRLRYDVNYEYNDIQRRIIDPGIAQIHDLTNIAIHQGESTKIGKRVETLNFFIRKGQSAEQLTPMALHLIDRYKINKPLALSIVQNIPGRDISTILEAVEAARHRVTNLPAYAATIFRNYGLQDNAAPAAVSQQGNNDHR